MISTSKSSQGNRDELRAHRNALAHCEVRAATGLLIDTGRRPEKVCALPLDCLARDSDGAPVLVNEDRRANRRSGRLPITEAARHSDDDGRVSARLYTRAIAEQVAVLYWPRVLPDPLPGVGTAVVLQCRAGPHDVCAGRVRRPGLRGGRVSGAGGRRAG